jgi:hypothetical protein
VATRLAHTVEITTYTRATIGDVAFVVPRTSELVLVDPDRMQLRNSSRFDQYRRFAGTATIRYDPDAPPPKEGPRAAALPRLPVRAPITATLDSGIGIDAAIGDPFTAITDAAAHITGRITGMRRVGKSWQVELTLSNGTLRKSATLPLSPGAKLVWK